MNLKLLFCLEFWSCQFWTPKEEFQRKVTLLRKKTILEINFCDPSSVRANEF